MMAAAEKRWWATVLAIAAVVVAAMLVAIALYAHPRENDADAADIALVLGPPSGAAVERARELHREGAISSILLSIPVEMSNPSACAEPIIECRTPVPSTTEGEAWLLDAYASEVGAGSAIVISPDSQLERARFTFARCGAVPARFVGTGGHAGYRAFVYFAVYQSAAWIKTAVTPCGAFDF